MRFQTRNLLLRHITLSDLESYFECLNDKTTKAGFTSVPKNINEAKKELKMKILDFSKKRPFGETFAIEKGGNFAGYIEICHLNEKFREHRGDVGFCIHPKFRNKGIATEALKKITKYAFDKYKLIRLQAWCHGNNKTSAKVLKKAGYKLEGILRKNKIKDGKYQNDMIWAKVK